MQLISTIKIRAAQQKMQNSQLYKKQLLKLLSSINQTEEPSPLQKTYSKQSKTYLLIISSDRGLCGSYNSQLFKAISQYLKTHDSPLELILLGKKSHLYFKRFFPKLTVKHKLAASEIDFAKITDLMQTLQKEYLQGEFSELVLWRNQHISSIRCTLSQRQILPFIMPEDLSTNTSDNISANESINAQDSDTVIEPSAAKVLDLLLRELTVYEIYDAWLDAGVAELNSRITAMSTANDNAKNLISELKLKYNKARQLAITQEISEIVVGTQTIAN